MDECVFVSKFKYFLMLPCIYFSLAHYFAQLFGILLLRSYPFPFAPVISHWFQTPIPLVGRSPLQV